MVDLLCLTRLKLANPLLESTIMHSLLPALHRFYSNVKLFYYLGVNLQCAEEADLD